MSSIPLNIMVKFKDKEYKIDFTNNFNLLLKNLISVLEKEYKKKIKEPTNLFRIYYLDEDNDKLFIKNEQDYTYFTNISSEIFLEINEDAINQISSEEDKEEKPKDKIDNENKLKLLEKIEKLSKINEDLKKKNSLYNEMNKIYLEKISLLEEDKKLKNEKEASILNILENEKKQKNEILEQLDEAKKLNESMSMIFSNNNTSIIQNDEDNAKDILVNNLKEEKLILSNQLEDERKRINYFEKLYVEDNNKLKEKLNKLEQDFDLQKKQILINNDEIIKREVEKGINDFISKSKIDLNQKENEINKIKNDYENKINSIREECYQEMEQKYSKIYEEKLKQVYESAMNDSKAMYNNAITQNQQQFEKEEKKRNDIINSNLLMKSNLNNNVSSISRISQCKTVHKNIECNECKMFPIIGYRYKCLECPNYNLCDNCEKIVEHEHNFIRYVNEENIVFKNDNKYSYECLSSKLSVSVIQGTKEAELNIVIKNNGITQWTENSKFINGKESKINCSHIKLNPLKPEQQDIIEIKFDNLDNIPPYTYPSYLLFSVDDKIYCDPIKIEVNIVRE